jgi:hypothetical protein
MMFLKKIPEDSSIVDGDFHERIFFEDFDERKVGFFISIF